ncbi:SPOR domain-containing protein [Ancylomarina salipaludis]|uniref:SPOR domain-containing protein n=1 Tax=Ancylomarina salipaludis TaxID=2501299 RepID=A0A4Q1JPI3_9BACT|nr:SPOR domain-containing protein [Ancylomarina salipaludis]RXQ96799.1 SPOR domain-containing protein [Ancylomarina salipaludis]
MNRACIHLLILSMFFSFSVYACPVGDKFENIKTKHNADLFFVNFERADKQIDDTLKENAERSTSLIRRHSIAKDSTGIRYTRKYTPNNFPFFNFRISKDKVYHKLSEFNSDQAKELFIIAKNDQFNSDSLSREVNLLYTKQAVYSGVDKDLFKRRVHDLEQRAEELKRNAAQKAKHALALEQNLGDAPNLILAATHETAVPEYEDVKKVVEIKEPVKVVKSDNSESKALEISSQEEDEGSYLDYEYEYCYQVAVFDKRPGNDFYKGMGFIKEEIVDGGKSFRYLTGSYRTYAKASQYKSQIKSVFPAAFIVVYKNGIRTSLKEAMAVTDPVSITPPVSSEPQYASEASGEVSYRVQIGVFAGEIPEELNTTMEKYKAFGSFYEKRSDGKIVCTIGRFKSIADVSSLKKKLHEAGYKDAFTVAYSGLKRISLQTGINQTEKSNATVSEEKPEVKIEKKPLAKEDLVGGINFRVQIGVFANGVPEKVSLLMEKYRAFGTSADQQANGKTVCTIGHFDSIADAAALKKKLHEAGFNDVFTVAYTGNKRISIQDAIRLVE